MTPTPTPPSPLDASRGVACVDLAEPLPAIVDIPALGVRILVLLQGAPVGTVDIIGPHRLPAASLAAAIQRDLGASVAAACSRAGVDAPEALSVAGLCLPAADPPPSVAPDMTVVIATRNRPETLERCLTSLLAARPAPAEVIVVDNAPSDGRTEEVVQAWADHAPVTYVREPRPGLGRAHNAALASLRTAHVAFTDDDVEVHPRWVGMLDDALSATPTTVCATGLIAPAELRTPEQWWVERGTGFAKGFERRVRSLRDASSESVLFPYDAGTLGSGANMAFATDYLVDVGGFDPNLGTGTVSLGGDDLAALHQVIASGHDLVYEPAAIVFHRHHADRRALERQALGYGAGLGAYLAATVVDRPAVGIDLARRVAPGMRQVFARSSPLNERRPRDYPTSLVWRERVGMATGPVRYAWQRRLDHKAERQAVAG